MTLTAARSALRSPMRSARSLNTRANWHRWMGLEPSGFGDIYAERLRPIEGWRYRQDLALLYALARDLPGTGVTLEIGSFKGLATTALAIGCRDGGRAPVHTVDPHTGDRQDLEALGLHELSSLDAFRTNIAQAGVDDMVTPYVMTSDELAPQWGSDTMRLLFVDGWHSYDAVRSDLRNWVPRVDDGGVIVIAPDGQSAFSFNTPGMYRARANSDGLKEVAIFREDGPGGIAPPKVLEPEPGLEPAPAPKIEPKL